MYGAAYIRLDAASTTGGLGALPNPHPTFSTPITHSPPQREHAPIEVRKPLNKHSQQKLQMLKQVGRDLVLNEPLRLGARERDSAAVALREQRRDVLACDLSLCVEAVAELAEALGGLPELGLGCVGDDDVPRARE